MRGTWRMCYQVRTLESYGRGIKISTVSQFPWVDDVSLKSMERKIWGIRLLWAPF